MHEEGVRRMVVASAGSDLIAGSIGELDLLRAVIEGQTEAMASDIMSLDAPPTIAAGERLRTAVKRMTDERVDFFVVVDGTPSRPVGILSTVELVGYLARR